MSWEIWWSFGFYVKRKEMGGKEKENLLMNQALQDAVHTRTVFFSLPEETGKAVISIYLLGKGKNKTHLGIQG